MALYWRGNNLIMEERFEHPVKQPIRSIQIDQGTPGYAAPDKYEVGKAGVTRIEAATKSGMHADIPYVRVWAGEEAIAEFCQHNIVGVYFETPALPKLDEVNF